MLANLLVFSCPGYKYYFKENMAPFIVYSISTVLMSISGPEKVIPPVCYGINIINIVFKANCYVFDSVC